MATAMCNVGLIVAMKSEVPGMLSGDRDILQAGPHAVRLLVSGMGPLRARSAAERMCIEHHGFHPDYLMMVGFCGGAGKGLGIGHLVIADRIVYREREIEIEQPLVASAARAAQGAEHHIGKLQTCDWPVFSTRGLSADVLAVDMESFAIAETAFRHHLPAVIVKAVSDIVPPRASVRSILGLFRLDLGEPKSRLETFVQRYFQPGVSDRGACPGD
jgi:nucleoside phosphorylase